MKYGTPYDCWIFPLTFSVKIKEREEHKRQKEAELKVAQFKTSGV
jgi:hypothetical protein